VHFARPSETFWCGKPLLDQRFWMFERPAQKHPTRTNLIERLPRKTFPTASRSARHCSFLVSHLSLCWACVQSIRNCFPPVNWLNWQATT